jgi:hypothetical protein
MNIPGVPDGVEPRVKWSDPAPPEVGRRRCVKCGAAFFRFTVQRDHRDRPLLVHSCGCAYTPEFIEDYYGIPATAWNFDPGAVRY